MNEVPGACLNDAFSSAANSALASLTSSFFYLFFFELNNTKDRLELNSRAKIMRS